MAMHRAGAEIRLLGSVRLDAAGGPVPLGPRRRRLVLAVLALEVNRLVPVERLVDLAWPDDPPRTATHAIRVCVSGLRAVLAAAGVGPHDMTIDTRGGGYLLRTDPERIDAGRFHALLGRAAGTDDDPTKVAVLDEALALWSGPALSGIASEETRLRLARGLEEARLSAVEDRVDARLRLGCHAQVLSELTTAVQAHPGRERLVFQLMLALYRNGQSGAALQAYRDARQRLADEFGLDPGAAMQRLEVAILRGDPALQPPAPGPETTPDPVDPVAPAARPEARAVPAQLPATVGDFTGRDRELAALDVLAPGRPGPSTMVVAGMAGVGKTALAVRWAHRVRQQFPDGQLFADLAGFSTDPPAAPLRVLGEFLSALGVPGGKIPVGLTEASALYRSLLADKRVLVVLDNAADADQVRPLLPGGPDCRVVVTSRRGLGGLVARDGARRLALDVLTAGDAVDLLNRIVGADEPDACVDLARLCAYLPLAIRIAAANVSACPGHRVFDQVARLRDTDRLDSLSIDADDQAAVRAAFDLSYGALTPPTRRMFGLLGIAPGPHIGVPAAAALAGVEPVEAARILEGLAGANLVERRSAGRYAMHDLLRLYAGERAGAAGPADTATAVDRLDAFYLDAAGAAAAVLYPSSPRLAAAPDGTAAAPGGAFADDCAAGAWLDSERPNLVATVVEAAAAGRATAWLLADAMGGYLFLRRHGADWLQVARAAFAAAERSGDASARASAHRHLGGVHLAAGQFHDAVAHLRPALEFARAAGWKAGEAAVHNSLGIAYDDLGELDRAAAHFSAAQALYRGCGLVSGALAALSNLGSVHGRAGRLAEAADAYRRSLDDDRRRESRSGEAADLSNLGGAVWRMGRLDEALGHLTAGLALHRTVGNRAGVANSLDYLARVHADAGRLDLAARCAEEALAVAREIGDRRIEVNVRNGRAGIHARRGRVDVSAAWYECARSLAVEAAFHHGEAEALIGLSRASRCPAAVGLAQQALTVTVRHGFRLLECDARVALAEARLDDDPAAAAEQVRLALTIQRETGYRRGEQNARQILARAVEADLRSPMMKP